MQAADVIQGALVAAITIPCVFLMYDAYSRSRDYDKLISLMNDDIDKLETDVRALTEYVESRKLIDDHSDDIDVAHPAYIEDDVEDLGDEFLDKNSQDHDYYYPEEDIEE